MISSIHSATLSDSSSLKKTKVYTYYLNIHQHLATILKLKIKPADGMILIMVFYEHLMVRCLCVRIFDC